MRNKGMTEGWVGRKEQKEESKEQTKRDPAMFYLSGEI